MTSLERGTVIATCSLAISIGLHILSAPPFCGLIKHHRNQNQNLYQSWINCTGFITLMPVRSGLSWLQTVWLHHHKNQQSLLLKPEPKHARDCINLKGEIPHPTERSILHQHRIMCYQVLQDTLRMKRKSHQKFCTKCHLDCSMHILSYQREPLLIQCTLVVTEKYSLKRIHIAWDMQQCHWVCSSQCFKRF
jgi:hypothetical protein